MTTCPTCGAPVPAATAATVADLRAINAHRSGKYATAYRYGLDVAEGLARPLDAARQGQGYRDGLALRPYRLPPPGRGSVARNVELQRIRRIENKLKIVEMSA